MCLNGRLPVSAVSFSGRRNFSRSLVNSRTRLQGFFLIVKFVKRWWGTNTTETQRIRNIRGSVVSSCRSQRVPLSISTFDFRFTSRVSLKPITSKKECVLIIYEPGFIISFIKNNKRLPFIKLGLKSVLIVKIVDYSAN